jgi:hypothetical protein
MRLDDVGVEDLCRRIRPTTPFISNAKNVTIPIKRTTATITTTPATVTPMGGMIDSAIDWTTSPAGKALGASPIKVIIA